MGQVSDMTWKNQSLYLIIELQIIQKPNTNYLDQYMKKKSTTKLGQGLLKGLKEAVAYENKKIDLRT